MNTLDIQIRLDELERLDRALQLVRASVNDPNSWEYKLLRVKAYGDQPVFTQNEVSDAEEKLLDMKRKALRSLVSDILLT